MRNIEEAGGGRNPGGREVEHHHLEHGVHHVAHHDVVHHVEELDPEAGLATAEYAVATVAAVGFAGLLIAVLKSDTVRGLLESIISSALSI